MAEAPLPDPTKVPNLRDQAAQQMAGWLDVANLTQASTWVKTTGLDTLAYLLGWVLKIAAKIGATLAGTLARAEDKASPEFGELAAAAVADLFGVSNPGGATMTRGNRGGRTAVANDVGDMLFKAFSGAAATPAGGEIQPSDAPAKAFLSTMTQLALEGWLEGWIVEACTLGQLETFGELDDIISHVLGLGRASAAVHGPLVNDLIVTPLKWKLNKEHRPTLLGASEVARQLARGKYTKAEADEELSRMGYTAKRIEAIISAAAKTFSPSDVRTFEYRQYWSHEQAVAHLVDQGYTADQARDALRLEGLRRFDELERQEASAIANAYAQRDIDDSEMGSLLQAAVSVETERNLWTELARVRRQVNTKHLSLNQVETMVKSEVLSVIDYRQAAEREGYGKDAVTALELQLRWELDKQTSIEEHRAALERDRTARELARAAERAARLAVVAAERALQRRGSEADLERAVIHGQIAMARLKEVYTARYDADTVDLLVASVEDQRLAYLAQQQAREDALLRAGRRNIDVGALTAAFMSHLLSPAEFTARLVDLGFDQADAELVAATQAVRLEEQTRQETLRAEAAARARDRQIDLGRFESLVRRGARTMVQYTALLAELGYADAAIADMVALLQMQIDEDAAARALRATAAARSTAGGLTLEQMRRAVVLGIKSVDDYNAYLVGHQWNADAQIVLMAELRHDLAAADSARARRQEKADGAAASHVPLSTVRRAAQLGLVSPQTYLSRLEAEGYTADDLELETALLLFEVAEVQEARGKRDASAAAAASTGLTLGQVERAVKLGTASLDDYRNRAIALRYDAADVQVLANSLAQELVALRAAQERHDQAEAQLGQRDLSLGQIEAGVKAGLVTLDAYVTQLGEWGYDQDEAELLASLLASTLPATGD